MRKLLLATLSCIGAISVNAQTVQLFFDDFESGGGSWSLNTGDEGCVSGTSGDNEWVINSVYAGGTFNSSICFPGNPVTVGATPGQPVGITSQNGNYLHILSQEAENGGVLNANYALADNQLCFFPSCNFMSMNSDINTIGMDNITIDFWWLNEGSVNGYGEVMVSLDGGTSWTTVNSGMYGQGTWTQSTFTDPSWANQPTVRFAFKFMNDADQSLSGTDPAWSIDDVLVTGDTISCSDSFSSISATGCNSYTVPSGDETYTTPGTMTVNDTIPNATGCDSIMTINLTINSVDTSVVNNLDGSATAQSASGTFQWLYCDSAYTAISGATSATYNATSTGGYAVEVTENGCVDTSACTTIQIGGLGEFESSEFNVFPNPNQGSFSIDLSGLKGNQKLMIIDTKGAIVYTETVPSGGVLHYDLTLEKGIYLIELVDQHRMIRRSRLVIK
ncbi:MAG: T9SS type A sorting domain-containing protein [Crocinitomicaceae bacterium]|nr:T9SS type A sorting domain-containing protein [Crocinitomicaceae bacterium]